MIVPVVFPLRTRPGTNLVGMFSLDVHGVGARPDTRDAAEALVTRIRNLAGTTDTQIMTDDSLRKGDHNEDEPQ